MHNQISYKDTPQKIILNTYQSIDHLKNLKNGQDNLLQNSMMNLTVANQDMNINVNQQTFQNPANALLSFSQNYEEDQVSKINQIPINSNKKSNKIIKLKSGKSIKKSSHNLNKPDSSSEDLAASNYFIDEINTNKMIGHFRTAS